MESRPHSGFSRPAPLGEKGLLLFVINSEFFFLSCNFSEKINSLKLYFSSLVLAPEVYSVIVVFGKFIKMSVWRSLFQLGIYMSAVYISQIDFIFCPNNLLKYVGFSEKFMTCINFFFSFLPLLCFLLCF